MDALENRKSNRCPSAVQSVSQVTVPTEPFLILIISYIVEQMQIVFTVIHGGRGFIFLDSDQKGQ
jgi:hypothetical protein